MTTLMVLFDYDNWEKENEGRQSEDGMQKKKVIFISYGSTGLS